MADRSAKSQDLNFLPLLGFELAIARGLLAGFLRVLTLLLLCISIVRQFFLFLRYLTLSHIRDSVVTNGLLLQCLLLLHLSLLNADHLVKLLLCSLLFPLEGSPLLQSVLEVEDFIFVFILLRRAGG